LKTTLTVTPLPGLGVGLLSEAIIDASLDDRAETKLIEKPTITMKVIMDANLDITRKSYGPEMSDIHFRFRVG